MKALLKTAAGMPAQGASVPPSGASPRAFANTKKSPAFAKPPATPPAAKIQQPPTQGPPNPAMMHGQQASLQQANLQAGMTPGAAHMPLPAGQTPQAGANLAQKLRDRLSFGAPSAGKPILGGNP